MSLQTIQVSAVPSITIYVRHRVDCPRRSDGYIEIANVPNISVGPMTDDSIGKPLKLARGLAEERRRDIEDQFRAADPTKPVEAIAIQPDSRKTIGRAIELFLSDKKTQGLDPTAHKKHERELGRFKLFMENRGRFFPHEIGLDDLTEFRATWVKHYASSLTRSKVQERVSEYCFNGKMIDRVPQLSAIEIDQPPTLPLSDRQYERLLKVIPEESLHRLRQSASMPSFDLCATAALRSALLH